MRKAEEDRQRYEADQATSGPSGSKNKGKGKAFVPNASAKKGSSNKKDGEKKTIRMMHGVTPWDPLESLKNTPVVGLNWGNLISLAPKVKATVCKGMVMEKYTPIIDVAMVDTIPSFLKTPSVTVINDNQGFTYGDAIPEPAGIIINFYTVGFIRKQSMGDVRLFRVPRILIDGGAVVNMMPEAIADKLGLPTEFDDDCVIRTATNEIKRITKCAKFHIEIAGVLAAVKVYLVDIPQSYSILLGRRWLQQVRAMGDYRLHSYVIFDQYDKHHEVPQMCLDALQLEEAINYPPPEVMLNNGKSRDQMNLTDVEYEELALGKQQMNALLEQLIAEAKEEERLWEEDVEDDEEEEDMEILGDSEGEDHLPWIRDEYRIPKMTGKGGKY